MTYTLAATIDYPLRGILVFGNVLFCMTVIIHQAPGYLLSSFRKFLFAVQYDSPKLIETCVALFCLGPACWLFRESAPGDRRWDVLLALVMPLWVYAVTMLVAGVSIIAGLQLECLLLRRVGQALALFIWTYLFGFFVVQFPHFLVVPIAPVICLMALRSYWYLGRLPDGPTDNPIP